MTTQTLSRNSWADLWRLKTSLQDGHFVFSDLKTDALMWQVQPAPCDGRSEDFLNSLHQQLTKALASLPEQDPPWVLQWFLSDESDFPLSGADFCPHQDPLSNSWREVLNQHLERCRKGLFRDAASRTVWRTRQRRVRMMLYPAAAPSASNQRDNPHALHDAAQRLCEALNVANLTLIPVSGRECLNWLSSWLSGSKPPTDLSLWTDARGAIDACFQGSHHGDLPLLLLNGQPVHSDNQSGCWQIGEQLHRFLPLGQLEAQPEAGSLTAELPHPEGSRSFWDLMPPNAVFAMSAVQISPSRTRRKINQVLQRARGPAAEAEGKRQACRQSLEAMAHGEQLIRVSAGLYLSAASNEQMETYSMRALALFAARGWQLNPPRQDHFHLDSWCSHLPGNFDPNADSKWFRRRSRLWYSYYLAAMLPLYGRSRGTGTPGALFFNRGGEPALCDPMSQQDRVRNAHSLIIGPTGSGKTALLIYLLLSMAARHRPRLFLVTTLPTFGLLGDYLESQQWRVHRVQLKAEGGCPIPPFASALKACQSQEEQANHNSDGGADNSADSADNSANRDRISELELIASLMVSDGADGRLKHWQSDLLREAVLAAAKKLQRDPMVSEVVSELRGMATNARLPDLHRQSILEMAGAMNRYTRGVAGAIFNRPGTLWPEADCTILDLGIAGRRGYEHLRTLAYITFIQRINDLVEKTASDKRQTLVVTDEAHVILGEPQLAAYLNSITAQWRIWGAWKWVVTQSLRQIPEASRAVLNMMEWWWCLGLDKDETASVAQFRGLAPEQTEMLLSTQKEPGKYVEVVVMSDRLNNRFRAVLPALALALAQTEKEERAHRAEIMAQKGLSELEAALEISRTMNGKAATA